MWMKTTTVKIIGKNLIKTYSWMKIERRDNHRQKKILTD